MYNALLEFGILYDSLHDDSAMNGIPLFLHEAVPPWRGETTGDHQSQGGIGVHGGEILLDPPSDAGGHVQLVDLGECACHQTIQEPWNGLDKVPSVSLLGFRIT